MFKTIDPETAAFETLPFVAIFTIYFRFSISIFLQWEKKIVFLKFLHSHSIFLCCLDLFVSFSARFLLTYTIVLEIFHYVIISVFLAFFSCCSTASFYNWLLSLSLTRSHTIFVFSHNAPNAYSAKLYSVIVYNLSKRIHSWTNKKNVYSKLVYEICFGASILVLPQFGGILLGIGRPPNKKPNGYLKLNAIGMQNRITKTP